MAKKAGKKFCYEYPRAALTVDCVIFGLDAELQVLLIERDLPPFEGQWALPGGFVRLDETLEEAARRELREETGVIESYLEQLGSYSAVDRDPRERVITTAFMALSSLKKQHLRADTDARRAAWFSIHDLPPLAFDHGKILADGLERLRHQIRFHPIGFGLLPNKFTLTELQTMYEQILDTPLDRRNFRKKILSMELLVDLNERQKDVRHRAARLYAFDPKIYRRLVKQGFRFRL